MRKTYTCPWCNLTFDKDVEYQGVIKDPTTGQSQSMKGKKKAFSTMVVCPGCFRTIPTWKKEEIKAVVGRKHIHWRI
jgi:uncharacterized protein (DUF2225 family)